LFILVLAVICNIVIASVFFTSRVGLKKSGFRREYVAILNIAEAGKEDGISKLRWGNISPQSDTRIGLVSNNNFGGGSYAVTCSANTALDTLWVFSVAQYMGKTKSIEAIYKVTGCSPSGDAFDKGICAGGDIGWTGSGSMTAGSNIIHCNGFFNMSGSSDITANIYACNGLSKSGSCDITGDVWAASVSQTGSGSITGTVTLGTVSNVTIPDLDWTPYYTFAQSNGQVYTGNQHISGSSNHIVPGGVMWVNGDFKRSGSGDFTGCIIATGNVTFSGSGDCYKVNNYPLAVSINGKIDFSGSGEMNGLLYAQNGDFEKTGSGNVTGSIICKGDFRKSGSWDFLTYVKSVPVAPGCNGNKYTKVSWRECN
jgi:hypothetical protein